MVVNVVYFSKKTTIWVRHWQWHTTGCISVLLCHQNGTWNLCFINKKMSWAWKEWCGQKEHCLFRLTQDYSDANTCKFLQQWLYCREQLKYVWNVYCVLTNHRRDLHTIETTGNVRSPISHGTNYFCFVQRQSCLIRNLKHQLNPW